MKLNLLQATTQAENINYTDETEIHFSSMQMVAHQLKQY